MGIELDSKWYDNTYLKRPFLRCKPEDSPWYCVWLEIIKGIGSEERIADFGCGGGQFAHLCVEHGKHYAFGVDFSEERIKGAKKLNPTLRFIVGNLYDKLHYNTKDYDVAIFCEVLEHLSNDLTVLSYIPPNKKIIMSLPSYDSAGHVRHFKNIDDIESRYGNIVKNTSVIKVGKTNKIFVAVVDRH